MRLRSPQAATTTDLLDFVSGGYPAGYFAAITKHGRDRLVVVSAAEYERLKRRDRQVFQSDGLPSRVLELIAEAEVPAEYTHLDSELEDAAP